MEIVIGIQKYLSTYHYTFRLPNIFGSFFSLVAYHLANVNGLIQKGTIDNLCESFYDTIHITFFTSSENKKTLDKKEITKRYLDNGRHILGKVMSIFYIF